MSVISFGQVIPVTGPNLGFPGTVSRQGERVVSSRQFNPFSASYNLNFGDPAILIENSSGGYWTSVLDAIENSVANVALIASRFAGIAVREVQTQLAYPYGSGITPGQQQVGYYAPGQMADVLERGSATILASVYNSPVAGGPVYTRVVLNSAVSAGTIGDWEVGPPAATDLVTSVLPSASIDSTTITLNATLALYIGMAVSGPGIAPGSYIVSGTGTPGAYTVVVLNNATIQAITAGSPIVFNNLVLLPNVVQRTGYVDANSIVEITITNRNQA
jgi:hypothetical protein